MRAKVPGALARKWVLVPKQSISIDSSDPWAVQKEQFNQTMARNEQQELGMHSGRGRDPRSPQEAFRRLLNKNKTGTFIGSGNQGPYRDA